MCGALAGAIYRGVQFILFYLMTTATSTIHPVRHCDFTKDDLRTELVDTLYCYVSDEVKRYMSMDPSTAELEGVDYQNKLDETLAYLEEHLVIRFIR